MVEQEMDMKRRILLAAKKLFAAQGYDATSVRQICEEAGANVALVSYHFGGKESVFYAIFRQLFPLDKVESYKDMNDPVEGIRLLIEEVISLRAADPELVSLLQLEIIMQSPRMKEIQTIMFPLWGKVRELLGEGRRQGLFRFESADNTLLFVLGAIFFYKQRGFFEPLFTEARPETADLIAQTTHFVMNGLGYQEKGE